MSESISATIKNSGLTLDSVFVEVQHSEGLNLPKANHIRFFHTAMRGNRLSTDNLQVFLRRNLARYVFSRAQLENYRIMMTSILPYPKLCASWLKTADHLPREQEICWMKSLYMRFLRRN